MTEPTAAPAGRRPTPDMLVDVDRLVGAYYDEHPDPSDPAQAVSFGTSGHRGTSLAGTFTEDHIVAISEAIARYRTVQGIDGPLFLGRDTHALSAAGVPHRGRGAGRAWRRGRGRFRGRLHADAGDLARDPDAQRARRAAADGIVITPSHNPPEDGGFKYNPPHGGPADTDVTRQIQDAANELLRAGLHGVQRLPFDEAIKRARRHDYRSAYVGELSAVVDVDEIAGAGIRLGVDPLGGASVAYWEAIADRYRLDLEVVNDRVDPTFSFMPLDHDGKIRMDCSSPDAMAGLISLKDRFDVAFANDPDADRHGIVTRERGSAEPEPLPRGRDRVPARRRPPRLARRRRRGQDDGVEQHHRPRRGRARAPARGGARSASSGSSPACSTARWRSGARRAPARASFAATAAPGARTRTG